MKRLSLPQRAFAAVALSLASFFGISSSGQAQSVTVAECNGRLTVCLTPADSLYELCVKVTIPPGHCPIKSFTLDWGDGVRQTLTSTAVLEFKHVYNLRDIVKNCSNDRAFLIGIRTVNDNCAGQPADNNFFEVTFKNKPRANFSLPDICEGRSTSFSNFTCPNNSDVVYAWEFGDGQTSTSPYPSHSFPTTAGSYKVKLTATNGCGTDTKEQTLVVRKAPIARYTTTGFTVANQDTVVCLANDGTLTMNGTTSVDASRYQWQISGGVYTFLANTHSNSPSIQVRFSEANEYTVTLTAGNDCGSSTPVTRRFRVLRTPVLTLARQADVCAESHTYQLVNPNAAATYTFNGQPLAAGQSVLAPKSPQPYVVTGTLSNQCGTQTVADTFSVQDRQGVQITSPPKDTTLCLTTARLPLTANLTDGRWQGDTALLERQGTQTFFNPRTAGVYTLRYVRGASTCLAEASVRITVPQVAVTAQNATACEGQPFVRLVGSQSGGTWSSTLGAIRGDTLLLTGVTAISIPVTYEIRGGGGCPARATATVTVGRPRAAFSLGTGNACAGTPLTLQN